MSPTAQLDELLRGSAPVLALAPMQDITDLPFMRLIASCGGPDLFYTEYFRVYKGSHLIKTILRSVTENTTGIPVIAQMIGNDIPALVRTAKELQQFPVAAIDLNLGCPAPIVYKKCAGGGLLRNPGEIDAILGHLRQAITTTRFTVKTRLGFESTEVFARLLPIFAKHSLDLLTVHGRTVAEKYFSDVHYDLIARAVAEMPCPVLANGNIISAKKGAEVLRTTGARGLMIGRGAIRNPWLFHQVREHCAGRTFDFPRGIEVLAYVQALYDAVCTPGVSEVSQVQKLKKYMNFLGLGVDHEGAFLHQIRRVSTRADFFGVCDEFLSHERPMPLEPVVTRLGPADVLAGEHL